MRPKALQPSWRSQDLHYGRIIAQSHVTWRSASLGGSAWLRLTSLMSFQRASIRPLRVHSSDFTTLQDEGEWPVARDTGSPCPWLGAQWLQADGSEEDSMGDYQSSAQGCPSGKHGDSWVVSKEFLSAQSWGVLGEPGTLRSCGQGEDEPKTAANSCGVSFVKVR